MDTIRPNTDVSQLFLQNMSAICFIMVALCNRAAHYIFALSFMAALCNRGGIIFLPCDFFLSSIYLSFFFFSSPNLSRRRLDVYHTLTHMVWP